MAKIEVDLEVNSGKSKSQAKQAGKEAGEAFAGNISSEAKGVESELSSSTKKAGSKAAANLKSAGKEGGSGFESGVKSGVSGAEGSFGGLDGAIGKVKGAAAGLAAAFSFDAIISSIQAAIDKANEFQEDLGKLQTAAEYNGFVQEDANDAYRDLVGLMGEVDQSVEATNQLMLATGGNTEQLDSLTRSLAGAYGIFSDALQPEMLAEGVNETVRLGEASSGMVQALEQSGVSVDEFNAQLATMTTEEERAQFVTDTLNELFGEAGDVYRETNGALIEYRQAQSDLNLALAGAGTALMPFSTLLVGSALPAIQGMTEVLNEFMPTFSEAFSEGNFISAGESLGNMVTDLLGYIIEQAPAFLDAGIQLIGGLALGFVEGLPDLLVQVVSAITEAIPMLIETAIELVTALVEALPDIVQSLVDSLPQILDMVFSVFGNEETITKLVNAFITLFLAVIENLPTIIQILVQAIPMIVTSLIETLTNPTMMEILLNGFVQLFMAFLEALPQIIAIIIGAIPQIISAIVTAILNNAPTIRQTAIDLFIKFKDGIGSMIGQIGAKAAEIGNTIISKLRSIPGQVISIGQNIVQGLWNGISNMGSWIASKIQGFGDGVLNDLKNFFGIHSPSTLMRDAIGKFIGQGIAVGIPIGFNNIDPMPELGKSIMNSAQLMFAGAGMTTNNNSATYNINQPIATPDQLAMQMRKIQRYGLAGHKL